MHKRKNQVTTAGRILIAVYVVFILSVVAYACHQDKVLHYPSTFQDSVRAVLSDTCYLHDPRPDSMRKVLEKDTDIINHSQIPTENR